MFADGRNLCEYEVARGIDGPGGPLMSDTGILLTISAYDIAAVRAAVGRMKGAVAAAGVGVLAWCLWSSSGGDIPSPIPVAKESIEPILSDFPATNVVYASNSGGVGATAFGSGASSSKGCSTG